MSRRLVIALAAAAVLVPALPADARAANLAVHCSPGRYCISIAKDAGQIRFRLLLLESRATRYRLCVTPPRGGRSCKTFRMQRIRGVRGSDIRWTSHFPNEGRGLYRVRWSIGERTLGKTLSFRRR